MKEEICIHTYVYMHTYTCRHAYVHIRELYKNYIKIDN